MRRGVWRCALRHAAAPLPSLPPAPAPTPALTRALSRVAQPRRLRHHLQSSPPASPSVGAAATATAQKKAPRLRVADHHVAALVARRTTPADFVVACRALAAKDPVTVLAATDLHAWNLALQHRLVQHDVAGARALLALVGSFDAENTSTQLWTDLLFTLLRQQHSALSDGNEIMRLLDALCDKCGTDFVAQMLVSVVNGCANIKMFAQARFLVLYHLELGAEAPLPPRIVGTLVSAMSAKHHHADVIDFTMDLFNHPRFRLEDFQQQGFIALFRSHALANEPPTRAVAYFLKWFQAKSADLTAHREAVAGGGASSRNTLKTTQHAFERVFGAAIQCCVETQHPRLALRCYDAMLLEADDGTEGSTRVIPVDENIYVNVLKACVAQSDAAMFKDVYRAMVRDGVARGPGFGSAIRFCTTALDSQFLEEVLEDAFALEDALQGAWMLAVEQYNDALGCFATTRQFDLGKDLFARMTQNPFIVPNQVTMLEVVENHRDASFSEVFHIMELFLEWELCPDLKVFTSLLATCARRRLVGDAVALMDAMQAQGIEPDVKTYTVIAFVYGTHADVGGIVRILETMAAKGVATDQLFFKYVMNALYGASGIDVCFSLFREMRVANLPVPEGLYGALVDVGTRAGLVERTLHIAYNMECDGFALSSQRMQALIARCESTAELNELIRTFVLLHQGYQSEGEPRFDAEVYESLIKLLARFSKKDMIPKIRKLAEDAGHALEP